MAELKEKLTMRTPFEDKYISKLPKGTKAQNECKYEEKKYCNVCGGFHHPKIKHLDYVGHAALTDRMLKVDLCWNWSPLALSVDGTPLIDSNGGMWIELTILNMTRLGYGDAQGKTGGNAMKERIGDALRNAAMRFGAALDLWSKEDLDNEEEIEKPKEQPKKPQKEKPKLDTLILIGKSLDVDWKEILAKYKVDGLKKLTDKQVKEEIKILKEAK